MVDYWVKYYQERGISAVKTPAIRWIGQTDIAGYPDIFVKLPDVGLAAIEIKTGENPGFTEQQKVYLPMLTLGLHLYSNDERIRTLGLLPGVPFPPMKVYLVYSSGPGEPYIVIEPPHPKQSQ